MSLGSRVNLRRLSGNGRRYLGNSWHARRASAGVVDAGLGSLGTLMVGVYAARALSPEALGLYSVYFAAFVATQVIPAQLILVPYELASLDSDTKGRLWTPRWAARLGFPVAAVSAAGGMGIAALASGASSTNVPIAVTAIAATFVSPLQDHVRRTFHYAEESWGAVIVSTTQALACGGLIGTAVLTDVAPAWVPFGALAGANIISFSVGWMLMSSRRPDGSRRPSRVGIVSRGKWLVALQLVPRLASLIAGVIVVRVAGAAVLGYVEAARIVGQPLNIVVTGMAAVLIPKFVAAAAANDQDSIRELRRFNLLVTIGLALVYLVVAVPNWTYNPMALLVPKAYVYPVIVPLMVGFQALEGSLMPYRAEFIGRRAYRALVGVQALSSALLCAVSATAGWLGVYAKPIGMLAADASNLALLRRARASDESLSRAAQ